MSPGPQSSPQRRVDLNPWTGRRSLRASPRAREELESPQSSVSSRAALLSCPLLQERSRTPEFATGPKGGLVEVSEECQQCGGRPGTRTTKMRDVLPIAPAG